MHNKSVKFLFLITFLLSACSSAPLDGQTISAQPVDTTTTIPSKTPSPTSTPIPPTPTSVLQSEICSPLETETKSTIKEIITQPYKQPRIGIEDGYPAHHGVDFSHYRRNGLLTIEGVAVLSALDGEVVTIIQDKYPYGHALIIETPLDTIDPSLLSQFNLPNAEPTVIPDPKFEWLPVEFPFTLSEDSRSLYILYAHLLALPEVQVGDKVTCGQRIGQVGNTGDSSNPHLHFETRIGPSGARFESMAYYITQSSASERYNYVVWRLSNLFQVFDPMLLLDING